MKTESELRKELEERAEIYRKDGVAVEIVQRKQFCDMFMWIWLRNDYGSRIATDAIEYKPDPVIPADMRAVFVSEGNETGMRISAGTVNKDGSINCYFSDDTPGTCRWSHWYNPATGEHSPDFPVDSLPKRFIK